MVAGYRYAAEWRDLQFLLGRVEAELLTPNRMRKHK
jgi:hypothetical protein